jgi:hypothetical protein
MLRSVPRLVYFQRLRPSFDAYFWEFWGKITGFGLSIGLISGPNIPSLGGIIRPPMYTVLLNSRTYNIDCREPQEAIETALLTLWSSLTPEERMQASKDLSVMAYPAPEPIPT